MSIPCVGYEYARGGYYLPVSKEIVFTFGGQERLHILFHLKDVLLIAVVLDSPFCFLNPM
jgi:hypothetical protein